MKWIGHASVRVVVTAGIVLGGADLVGLGPWRLLAAEPGPGEPNVQAPPPNVQPYAPPLSTWPSNPDKEPVSFGGQGFPDSQRRGFDTEYSNVQAGVRLKILNLGGEMPMLRIENGGRMPLAVHSNMWMGVSFWKGNERVLGTENFGPSAGPHPSSFDAIITILAPGSNLELPLPSIYFNIKAEGYGFKTDWKNGLKCLPAGKYKVRFTSNGLGMTALDFNFSPFRVNFDIPEFEVVAKEQLGVRSWESGVRRESSASAMPPKRTSNFRQGANVHSRERPTSPRPFLILPSDSLLLTPNF